MNELLGSSRVVAEAEIVVRLNKNGTAKLIKDRYGNLAVSMHKSSKGGDRGTRYIVLSHQK